MKIFKLHVIEKPTLTMLALSLIVEYTSMLHFIIKRYYSFKKSEGTVKGCYVQTEIIPVFFQTVLNIFCVVVEWRVSHTNWWRKTPNWSNFFLLQTLKQLYILWFIVELENFHYKSIKYWRWTLWQENIAIYIKKTNF